MAARNFQKENVQHSWRACPPAALGGDVSIRYSLDPWLPGIRTLKRQPKTMKFLKISKGQGLNWTILSLGKAPELENHTWLAITGFVSAAPCMISRGLFLNVVKGLFRFESHNHEIHLSLVGSEYACNYGRLIISHGSSESLKAWTPPTRHLRRAELVFPIWFSWAPFY